MSEISRKKPLIRKRQSDTFHIKPKKETTKGKVWNALKSFAKTTSSGVKLVHKAATSEKAKSLANSIIEGGQRIAENQQRMSREGTSFGTSFVGFAEPSKPTKKKTVKKTSKKRTTKRKSKE